MTKYDLVWQETEVELLEALLLATGGEAGAPLQDVLLMADAVDGNVFSLKELEQGLEKLMAVGYVHIQKNKVHLTPAFLQDYNEMVGGAEGEPVTLMLLLQSQELNAEAMDEPKILIKKYKLQNQYQAYLEQFGG